MKKRTLSKLKSIFGSKKGKRQKQDSAKSSRSSSPEAGRDESPGGADQRFQPIVRTPPSSRVGPAPSPPVPMHPIAPVPPEPSGPLSLTPCPVCGRTFVPQSLSKHVKICQKMTVKKRKTFDSSRQRREGTDLEQYLPKNFGLPENSPFLEKSPPPTAKVAPKPKPPSVKTVMAKPAADLQRCPHCNRTFGVRAFERHVEWCADKAKLLPVAPAQPPPHIADAKQRLNARTQYKAPLARGRRSSQSRDKSSNSRSASVESSRAVSPPPQPREFGDYNKGRSRASESMSSNDHEEASPHVPVIRHSRNSQNNSGDANVKARQARLARDLSSSSNKDPIPDSRPYSVQKSDTDANVKKNYSHNKVKSRLSAKREQQLKKLEEISNKYNERKQKIDAQKKSEKSQIPVRKKLANKKTTSETKVKQEDPNDSTREVIDSQQPCSNRGKPDLLPKVLSQTSKTNDSRDKEKKTGNKIRKDIAKSTKESTISLDSLEELTPISAKDKNCQSIGINTELLCPSVPCVIHDAPDQKPVKRKTSKVEKQRATQRADDPEPKVELLYKNLNIVSSCNIRDEFEPELVQDLSITNEISMLTVSTSNNFTTDSIQPLNIYYESKSESTFEPPVVEQTNKKETYKTDTKNESSHSLLKEKIEEEIPELSAENFEEPYEHDLSEEIFDESTDKKNNGDDVDKIADVLCRHGSGDTYTKFTEDPADLEEFMNITDKMLNNNAEQLDVDKELDHFRTPNTNSLEVLQNAPSEDNIDIPTSKKELNSDTFEELKSHLKELLKGVKTDKFSENICESKEEKTEEEKRKVCDMEHITVYELKLYEKRPTENLIKEVPEFRLPSIAETNRPERKIAVTKKRVQNIYKHNSFKMLGDQNKANREYQTFIVKEQDDSDGQSISAEAPPLKLPRIEKKRLEDNYDPFLSAARQMKELMSSDTNLPKKVQNSCKDPSRTLPILRTAKEKPSLSYLRTDNSKIIKDSLNKSYQKTPTLQRIKSFGSTNNDNYNYSFGGRCSSFRVNRNEKKSSQKLNSTFTKSSKENISTTEKNYFNRSSNLNRSFSSYTASAYSTPKPKEKVPKISTSLYHSFQRTTIKQPVKLDKIKIEETKKDFVNLDSILADDNSSMTDSNYIDPRLINENDNLPINVNTILNNPDIISSMESLLTTENLPTKYDTLIVNTENNNVECNSNKESLTKYNKVESNNNINNHISPIIDNLSVQYDKIMSSLEQSVASKNSIRDDDSLCGDFDLEEFMITFDDEINKQKSENKRTCSSTTRVVKQSELVDSKKNSNLNSLSSSPKVVCNGSNGFIPVNKSMSLNFSSNNIVSESLFPSSVKRSTSLLDSIQKKNVSRTESGKSRQNVDKLEQDIMQSLKEFDKFYEPEKGETTPSKELNYRHSPLPNGPSKREARVKNERKSSKKPERVSNGNYTPNGKQSNDSAYSSLNRISPSKLSVCNSKESNGVNSLERIPAGSDSSGSHKDEIRSVSSDEFLAMERSAEMDGPLPPVEKNAAYKDRDNHHGVSEKRVPSRASSRRSSWRAEGLSSSGSEASLPRRAAPAAAPPAPPAPRPSRFCHECGARFPVDTAKFCIDCGVRRLVV